MGYAKIIVLLFQEQYIINIKINKILKKSMINGYNIFL